MLQLWQPVRPQDSGEFSSAIGILTDHRRHGAWPEPDWAEGLRRDMQPLARQ